MLNQRTIQSFIFACLIAVSACRTVGETGRTQLLLVDETAENKMGLDSYTELQKTAKFSTNAAYIAQVERVGKRIAAAANRPDYQWEFKVIEDDKTVNAFCLPGGKIAVYTGLLPVTQTDEGLAAVMGHEVAHATLRHGGERVSSQMLAQFGSQAVSILTQGVDPKVGQVVNAAYGVGTQVGVLLPFSRKHETEADQVGLTYMAKAGYNPAAAIDFWRRMEAASQGSPPEFLSTHPSNETRIADLQKALPAAGKIYSTTQTK